MRAILQNKEEFTSFQCDILAQCFNVLGKEDLKHNDSIIVDKLIAKGNFGVMMPY